MNRDSFEKGLKTRREVLGSEYVIGFSVGEVLMSST